MKIKEKRGLILNYGIMGAAIATSLSLIIYGLLTFFELNYFMIGIQNG